MARLVERRKETRICTMYFRNPKGLFGWPCSILILPFPHVWCRYARTHPHTLHLHLHPRVVRISPCSRFHSQCPQPWATRQPAKSTRTLEPMVGLFSYWPSRSMFWIPSYSCPISLPGWSQSKVWWVPFRSANKDMSYNLYAYLLYTLHTRALKDKKHKLL